jgi:hypothetical protein
MRRIIIALLLLFLGAAPTGAAETTSAPVYNPATKSYFQLVHNRSVSYLWDRAQREAGTKYFKGVAGRLAVIDSAETHQFLLENFDIQDPRKDIWIGLRYWCPVRMLQWEGQRLYSPTERDHFRAWHTPWHRLSHFCQDVRTLKYGYMGTYYTTINGVTLWQAVGIAKGFHYYLLEFPTGGV